MHEITLRFRKESQRRLNSQKAREQLRYIASGLKKEFPRWDSQVRFIDSPSHSAFGSYVYGAEIRLSSETVKETSLPFYTERIEKTSEKLAEKQRWERSKSEAAVINVAANAGMVKTVAEASAFTPVEAVKPKVKTPDALRAFGLPDLTDDVMSTHFRRIFNREPHIRVIYDSLNLAVKTGFKTRHHCLLRGKPACAKTELYLSFIDWLGEDMFWQVDASTMTKAGLETRLLKMAKDQELPPVIIVEEIEKISPENISALIQIMDSRAKIQRVNARVGDVSASCPVLVWATCNDESALKKFHDGAIWSRFPLRPLCERPNRELMQRILMREVEEIEGKVEWVPPVLDFLYDELSQQAPGEFDDPRLARSMLAGGDRLLDGSFLKDYRILSGMG